MADPPIWYQLTGVKELDRALEQFPKGLRRKMAKESLKKAAEPLLKTMQALAPVDSGKLKSKLTIKNMKLSKERWRAGVTGAAVTVKGKKLRYAYQVETGTSRAAPRPFARTAARAARGAVVAKFKVEIAKAVKTTAIKVRPKGTK
tara:strand:+ start:101 stop:538 length:438 start_codon:yes stop_codon:yes gene_type:complete